MSTSAIMGRISYRQESRSSLNANNRSNSLAFDLTNNILLYSPSGTDYYEFYPGKTSATNSGSVSSVGISSTTLNISGSPITSSGIIVVNLKTVGTSGIYTKNVVDQFGRVVSGSGLTSADIPALNYLSSSGTSQASLSASQSDKLKTSRNITLSGDVSSVSQSFDGSSNIGFNLSLNSTSVVSGTYGSQNQIPSFVVDSKGRLTSAGNISLIFPQTVSSVGVSSTTLSVSNTPITSSGNININLSSVGSSGTFTKVQTDLFGRVISGSALTSADIPTLNYLSISGTSQASLSAFQSDKLKTSRNITLSGDIQTSPKSFDGSLDIDFPVFLNNTGVVSGIYGSTIFTPQLVIDSKGRVISATNVFTSSTGSSGTSGNITIGLTSNTLTISNSPVTGNGFIDVQLSAIGTSGTFTKNVVDQFGRVISGSALTSADIPTLNYLSTSGISQASLSASQSDKLKTSRTFSISGDISAVSQTFDGSSNVTFSTILSNTSVVSGVYGSQNQIPSFTVDSKGRLTSAGNISISVTGGVSSVGVSSTTLSISNTPITSSGNITVNLSSVGSSGTYTKVKTDSFGRVVSGSNLTSADIPPLNYISSSGTSAQFIKGDGSLDFGNGFQNIIYQNLYLISGTSGNVSATSGNVKTFNYNLKPNMIGLLVSGTSAGSYSATYNIYSTTDGVNFSGIVYGTVTNTNNIDSSIFLNIYKDTSFVADLSVSGTVGLGGINIIANS